MKWIQKWLLSEWCVGLVILGAGIYSTFLYALRHFEIISDSQREYEIYLSLLQQSHWIPSIGTLLSSALWTTYLPSLIQHVLDLSDPSIVYRVTLALLTSPLLLVVYILLRRYTSITISVLMTVVFYTSFYYQSSISYARGQIALILSCVILLILGKKINWKWYPLLMLSIGGLAVAHYTTSYIYAGMFIGTGGLMLLYYLVRKKMLPQTVIIMVVGVVLFVTSYLWYNVTYHGVNSAISGMITALLQDAANVGIGMVVTPSLALDIYIAHALMALRLILMGIVSWLLWKQKRYWTKEGVMLFGSILAIAISLSIPKIDLWLGALRVGYILLPLQLIGVSYWWGRNRDDRLIIPLLALWAVIYH